MSPAQDSCQQFKPDGLMPPRAKRWRRCRGPRPGSAPSRNKKLLYFTSSNITLTLAVTPTSPPATGVGAPPESIAISARAIITGCGE